MVFMRSTLGRRTASDVEAAAQESNGGFGAGVGLRQVKRPQYLNCKLALVLSVLMSTIWPSSVLAAHDPILSTYTSQTGTHADIVHMVDSQNNATSTVARNRLLRKNGRRPINFIFQLPGDIVVGRYMLQNIQGLTLPDIDGIRQVRMIRVKSPRDGTRADDNKVRYSSILMEGEDRGQPTIKDAQDTASPNMFFEKFKEHFLVEEKWRHYLAHTKIDMETLNHYLKAKYEHYINGQPLESIGVSKFGFNVHSFMVFLDKNKKQFPRLSAGLGLVFDVATYALMTLEKVTGPLFEIAVTGITAVAARLNSVIFGSQDGWSADQSTLVVRLKKWCEKTIIEFRNDLTHEEMRFVDLLGNLLDLLTAGNLLKAGGKAFITGQLTKEASSKLVEEAVQLQIVKAMDETYKSPIEK